MARISVNDEHIVNGKVTVKRFYNESGKLVISGTFATHYYIDEIDSLDTYRYKVSGIEVEEEIFGSDDFDIVYNFIAKNLETKGISDLSKDDIVRAEKHIYREDGYLIGSNIIEESDE